MTHQNWDTQAARLAVYDRQGGLCALCWDHLGSREDGRWEAHHRLRRRDMPKAAQWCPCDLVALHARCHTQGPTAVHDQPEMARGLGLILDTTDDPRDCPVFVEWPWIGLATLDCDSMVVSCLD